MFDAAITLAQHADLEEKHMLNIRLAGDRIGVEVSGVDVIIAQRHEAGGHAGRIGTRR